MRDVEEQFNRDDYLVVRPITSYSMGALGAVKGRKWVLRVRKVLARAFKRRKWDLGEGLGHELYDWMTDLRIFNHHQYKKACGVEFGNL